MEDSRGNVWIGTWDRGLYRHDPSSDKYYTYPNINSRQSAHVIFEDSKHRIWVGSWGCGLFLLENAWEPERLSYKRLPARQFHHRVCRTGLYQFRLQQLRLLPGWFQLHLAIYKRPPQGGLLQQPASGQIHLSCKVDQFQRHLGRQRSKTDHTHPASPLENLGGLHALCPARSRHRRSNLPDSTEAGQTADALTYASPTSPMP